MILQNKLTCFIICRLHVRQYTSRVRHIFVAYQNRIRSVFAPYILELGDKKQVDDFTQRLVF